jgi:hypothetical protein
MARNASAGLADSGLEGGNPQGWVEISSRVGLLSSANPVPPAVRLFKENILIRNACGHRELRSWSSVNNFVRRQLAGRRVSKRASGAVRGWQLSGFQERLVRCAAKPTHLVIAVAVQARERGGARLRRSGSVAASQPATRATAGRHRHFISGVAPSGRIPPSGQSHHVVLRHHRHRNRDLATQPVSLRRPLSGRVKLHDRVALLVACVQPGSGRVDVEVRGKAMFVLCARSRGQSPVHRSIE